MTSNNALAARTCIVGVVVTNECRSGKCNNTNMCSDVSGPSSSGSGDLFELPDGSNKTDPESLALLAAILDLRVTTTPKLPFGARYVIIHKVYCLGYLWMGRVIWVVLQFESSDLPFGFWIFSAFRGRWFQVEDWVKFVLDIYCIFVQPGLKLESLHYFRKGQRTIQRNRILALLYDNCNNFCDFHDLYISLCVTFVMYRPYA